MLRIPLPQVVELRDILADALEPHEMDAALLRLEVRRQRITMAGNQNQIYSDVIVYFNNRDTVDNLLATARAENPTNAALYRFAQRHGLAAALPPEAAEPAGLEAIIRRHLRSFDARVWSERSAAAENCVCRISHNGVPLGTGFLVGPDLMLTNYHVFKNKEMLASAVVRFDYHANADGATTQGRVYEFQPDFYVGSPDKELDFALVKLKGEPLADRKLQPGDEDLGYLELLRRGRHRGYLLLAPRQIIEHERVNIIQHPNGNPQKVVLTQNYVLANMSADRVHYLADTLPGSSGSPVLNRYWEVIALHHSGGAHPPQKANNNLQKVLKGLYKFNEGIPIRAILPKIERYLPR